MKKILAFEFIAALVVIFFLVLAVVNTAHGGITSSLYEKPPKVYSGLVSSLNTASPICDGCPPGWSVSMGAGSFLILINHNLNLANPTQQISCSVHPYVFSSAYMVNNYGSTNTTWSAAVFNPSTGAPQSGTLVSANFICHVKH